MFKKVITYSDYNGVERTEDFYFNLTEAEVAEMELTTDGGLTSILQGLIDAKDVPAIMKFFKDFIVKSYGIKSPDGKRFMKSEDISRAFLETEAYSMFFMELASNADAASDFVKGTLPKMDKYEAVAPANK